MTRTIWITGAAGFIGGAATRFFAANGWRVIGFDRSRPDDALPSSFFHVAPIEGWILEAAIAAHGKPDVVFHAAGTGTVGQAQSDPEKSRRDTVDTARAVLDTLSRHAPGTRMIYPSSAAVYGNSGGTDALVETRDLSPASIYGRDKQEVEDLCVAAAKTGHVSVAVIRFFSVYGQGLRKQLPWELGQKLLSGQESVTLFGTGEETRDFLHIDDAIGLTAHLASAPIPASLIVNGGTGLATTIADFAAWLAAALDRKIEIKFSGETKPGDPKHMRADMARLNEIAFAPSVQLKSGLQAYAQWIKTEMNLAQ